jgi:hypothetical protein
MQTGIFDRDREKRRSILFASTNETSAIQTPAAQSLISTRVKYIRSLDVLCNSLVRFVANWRRRKLRIALDGECRLLQRFNFGLATYRNSSTKEPSPTEASSVGFVFFFSRVLFQDFLRHVQG